jgi:hypothetical protein
LGSDARLSPLPGWVAACLPRSDIRAVIRSGPGTRSNGCPRGPCPGNARAGGGFFGFARSSRIEERSAPDVARADEETALLLGQRVPAQRVSQMPLRGSLLSCQPGQMRLMTMSEDELALRRRDPAEGALSARESHVRGRSCVTRSGATSTKLLLSGGSQRLFLKRQRGTNG